jgi:hypothetical protein
MATRSSAPGASRSPWSARCSDRAARRREHLRALLAEKGEGVHHLGVAAPSFDETVAAQAERGNGVVLSGEFSGISVAYLATDRELGVVTEIFSGTPGAD